MRGLRIVADVGGTNSRFAVSAGPGHIEAVKVCSTRGEISFARALAKYVADLGRGEVGSWCGGLCIAAAGPVDAGEVHLTNATWSISARDLSAEFGAVPVRLWNDLEAVGLLLPHLHDGDVEPIGPVARAGCAGNRIAINVGTGFGASTAVRSVFGRWDIGAGEAGHMSLAPATAEEMTTIGFGQMVEDLLSGSGVGRLHAALLSGPGGPASKTSDEVFAALAHDPIAARTVAMLSRLLGRVAGDLVLAGAAWDGAYFCGSVARAWCRLGDLQAFRASFEDKGPMRERLSRVPTFTIRSTEPALLGLTYAEMPAA